MAVKAANARLCPMVPMRRGATQQPMKNPTKWADPSRPIWAVEKSRARPERASSGPTPPVESWSKMTDRKRAAKEIIRRMVGPEWQDAGGGTTCFRHGGVGFGRRRANHG